MEAVEALSHQGRTDEAQNTISESTSHEVRVEARQRRLREFFVETEKLLKDVPVKEVRETDPFIAKFKRMGILDVRS